MLYKSTPETRLVYADSSAFVGIGMTLRMHNQTDTVWLTDDDIVSDSFQLIQSISETEELNLGGCISSELTFEFDNSVCSLGESGNTFGKGCRIRLYRICTTDDGTTMTGIGYYFVDSITENEFLGTYKVVAYDILHFVMNDMSLDAFKNTIWDSQYTAVFNDGTRWMQLGIFRQFLIQTTRTYYTDSQGEYLFDYESYISVVDDESDYDLANDTQIICISAIDYSKTNAVELLRSIAELNCCFGYVNSWGRYDYIAYASNDFTTEQEIRVLGEETLQIDQTEDDSFCKSFSRENYKTSQIVGVIVCSDNDNLSRSSGTVSDGSNYYKVQGNTLLAYSDSTILTNIATNLNNLMNDVSLNDIYYPSEVEIELRPYVEVGDRYYSLYNTIDDNGNTTLKRFYGLVAKIIMGANFETLSIQGKDIRSNTETTTQSANSTINTIYTMRQQISDISDEVATFTDAEVVKHSDSYLYSALLSQTATDGTVLDKISTKWLHADRKADIKRHIKTGVPTGDGYYRYTIKVALDYMTSATFLGLSPLMYVSQLYVYARDKENSAYMRVGLKGTATIEFTSEYPNIFTVSGFDATYRTTFPTNYGYVPSLENMINPSLELNRVIGYKDIDILVADIDPDAGPYKGIRLYRPKTMTVAERVHAITAEIKKLNVEFVTLDNGIPPWCNEEFKYDEYGDPYQHAWVEGTPFTVPPIKFYMCEIDESNTSVNTALDTITIRFDVAEEYRSGLTYIKFLRDTWESSGIQTGIQVTMRVGFDNIGVASTQVPLTNAEIADGIILENGEYVWAPSEDSAYTAYGYWHNETVSYPYKRLSIPSYDYNFFGSLTNLAKDQNINLNMIAVSGTKKNTNVTHDANEWIPIDEDLGDRPTTSAYSNLSLSSYKVIQSKLIISDTYDAELGGYEIDVINSDDKMYELYLDLLELGSTAEDVEPSHYLESGVGNKYDESYEVIDIIGSGNDLTGTENLGKELTIIGSGNIALNFEDYEDGIEGIFFGNYGTGFLITLSGRLVYYEKYYVKDLSGATYSISINGYELTLTNESDETSITVTLPSYTLTRTEGEYTVTLTDSYDNAQSVSIEPIWADADDLTNSIEEIFGETVLSTEDGEYYFVTEDSTYKIQV